MSAPVGFDKVCIYNVIPRTTTKKAIQRDTLKNQSYTISSRNLIPKPDKESTHKRKVQINTFHEYGAKFLTKYKQVEHSDI